VSVIDIIIGLIWIVFWVYWLISAAGSKQNLQSRGGVSIAIRLAIFLMVVVIIRSSPKGILWSQHDPVIQAIGLALLIMGILLAIWARVYLGRNWGMPMSLKVKPQLVTTGPYEKIRHPIYSGIILAVFGTGLATSPYWFIAFVAVCIYFVWSAFVEERIMTQQFPKIYTEYKHNSKMFIPFIY
jgi:protein-S-isoprenylcysteine O-methyltransferase Ste14